MTISGTMTAYVTMGHGEFDDVMELHHDWPVPKPANGEVLVKVGACGLNNTDVNTRTGWYSKTVTEATGDGKFDKVGEDDPSWSGAPISFPRIQGADVCGTIVSVGEGVDADRVGQRIITDNWIRDREDPDDKDKVGYFGSECDGGFAEYTVMPSANALHVESHLSDAELATFSCSYVTAEGMLTRANLRVDDTVLVPGASGGVGGALVQLAKLRGARVVAMASEAKHADVAKLGPDVILPRSPKNLRRALGDEKITVAADVVGGLGWPRLIDVLERGGRYTVSGAIAGPMVELDLRTLYLRDLTFTGSTVTSPEVAKRVVQHTFVSRGGQSKQQWRHPILWLS